MLDMDRIRTAQERNVRAVELRPSVAKGTAVTSVRAVDGTTCEVREDDWRLTVDMPESEGGNGRGPTPGVLGRGALGSCFAVGYLIWASRLGVPIDSLSVEVQADFDARGELGMDDGVSPGYTAVRTLVEVASPAPRERVEEVLRTAERYSTYGDIFTRPVAVDCEHRIHGGDGS